MAEPNPKKEQFGSPEDVTTLFAWANMRGAKYRDFSASRAHAREEIRRRVLEAAEEERIRQLEQAQREAQEAAQRAAQEAAAQAEAIRRAEAERLAEIARQAEAERQAVLAAQEAQRRAQAQRQHAVPSVPPPVTAAPLAAQPAAPSSFDEDLPVTYEIAPAGRGSRDVPITLPSGHDSPHGRWKASIDLSAGAVPHTVHPPATLHEEWAMPTSTSVHNESTMGVNRPEIASPGILPRMNESPFRAVSAQDQSTMHPAWDPVPHPLAPVMHPPPPQHELPPAAPAQPLYADEPDPMLPSWLHELPHARTVVQPEPSMPSSSPLPAVPSPAVSSHPAQPVGYSTPQTVHRPVDHYTELVPNPGIYDPGFQARPQMPQFSWSAATAGAPQPMPTARQDFPLAAEVQPSPRAFPVQPTTPIEDPLLASRERITRNWFALKSVFHPDAAMQERPQPQAPERVPSIAVFSLAGGVGKTSLLAALSRALSSRAERVLLVDLSAYGLMPFFFGARDQKPGQLRTFSPPSATSDAPVQLITLDPEQLKADSAGQDALVREIQQYAQGAHRILIDLPTASGAAMRRVLRLNPIVLVPLIPDMNSVVSVGAIESFFQNQMAQSNAQSQPLYILNHFDPSQQLHVDVRNLLREQIGNRLLPFVLRSSPAISEALAEGMTVMDYAPGTAIAEDYLNLANWIRSLSAPAAVAPRGVRWSEQ